jgi:hypothetical protein
MTDLTLLAEPAFAPGRPAPAGLDTLERAVADSLSRLKPGRREADSLHTEMQRLALTNAVLMQLAPQLSPSMVAQVVAKLRPSLVIDEALKKTSRAHVEALAQAGIAAPVLELLQSWFEVTVDARVVQQQIELQRVIDSLQGELAAPRNYAVTAADPAQPLSAAELGQALGGLTDETVRQRERAGELFSIMRPGRKRGREYPAFQAWPGISGQPLAKVMSALGGASGTAAYGFFTSPTDLLGGLTPIEAMSGRLTTRRGMEPSARELLKASDEERLQAVIKTAQAHAAILAA